MKPSRRVLLGGGVGALSAPAWGFTRSGAVAATPDAGMVLGVQTHLSQGWPLSWLDVGRKLGATNFRDGLPWSAIEKRAGVYDFDPRRVDYLEKARVKGLDVLLTVDPRNPLYDSGETAFSSSARDAYARYLVAVLDRYGDVISAIEVGNELNTAKAMTGAADEDRAAAHVALLGSVWRMVKARHPKTLILGGSVNVIATGFLEAIFKAGGLDVMDGVAVHPYRAHAEHVDRELKAVTEAMRRHGPVRPIHATEFSDQFATPEMAGPFMLKMLVLMGSVHVKRAYWYALADQKWFRNMGLFTAQGAIKPGGQAFSFLHRTLMGHGDPERLPTDGRAFVYRYGSGMHVMWGAPRPIAFRGAVHARDPLGRIVETPSALGEEPVILDGDFQFTLGASTVVADSLLEYGAAPWFYQAETADGERHALSRIDWTWSSYLGDRRFQPLQFNADSLAPSGDGARPTRAVLGCLVPITGRIRVDLDFKVSNKGDGVDFQLLHNGTPVLKTIIIGQFRADDSILDLVAGDRLEFIFGPNRTSGGDRVSYRVKLLAAPS